MSPDDSGRPRKVTGIGALNEDVRILLVEDDPAVLGMSAYALRRERFAVIEASDGVEALRLFKRVRPDVVVLELGIPPPDGFEVLRRIRADDDTPVLVVTAHRDRRRRFRCFRLGADDFVTKPYAFRELALRIRAILRRAQGIRREESFSRLQLGDLRVDPEVNEVEWGPYITRLTPTELRIFHTLVSSAGHVVPTKRLFNRVWGGAGGDENSLRSHICHLRKKLGLAGGLRGSISSVPAVGYVFTTRPAGTRAAPTLAATGAGLEPGGRARLRDRDRDAAAGVHDERRPVALASRIRRRLSLEVGGRTC